MPLPPIPWENMPGADAILPGLDDLKKQRLTLAACLVSIAWPRIQAIDFSAVQHIQPLPQPEIQLYNFLGTQGGDTYGQYQSWIRRVIRFEHAIDHHLRRTTRGNNN
jgi:hypothetical protein